MSIPTSTPSHPSKICAAAALAILGTPSCSSDHSTPIEPLPDAQGSSCPTALIDDVRVSWWVFTGTILGLHQSTEEPPPPGIDIGHTWNIDNQAIVRIDDVASQPADEPLLIGEGDSIQFHDALTFQVGYQGHFMMLPYVAGRTHVFWERDHIAADTIPTHRFDAWVKEAQHYNDQNALYQRMIGARAVALVSVLDTADIPGQPILDNGADWWQAHVAVQAVLHGSLPSGTVPVRFDGSLSFCCYLAPKLKPGDQAIVVLYDDHVSGLPGTSYVISESIDLQPAGNQQDIEALLASPPVCPSI
jgi:hypothetical protein